MGFTTITTDQGSFYLVTATGQLQWYRDLRRDGSNPPDGSIGWDPRSGAQIGNGWGMFSHVISGGDGVLYAITPTGELHWYRDLRRDGTIGWDPRSGAQIGRGWNIFDQVVSGGNGVLYAITPTGELHWYRDLRRDGTNAANGSTGWDPRSGAQIGSAWDLFTLVVPGGGGILYAVTVDGFLLFYQDLAGNGTARWAFNGVGQPIRSGWFASQPLVAAVQGYCVPQSAAPGETVAFKVSAPADYSVTYLRLKPEAGGGLGAVMAPGTVQTGTEHDVPLQAWRDGCGWPTAFSLTVANEWPSGIYAAQCSGSDGTQAFVTFVVRPAPDRRADLAVLANTNTWNAYNDWGGRSKYSVPPAAQLSFERPNPSTSPVDDGGLNHLTRAELWVLGWLEDEGFHADVYTDRDLDAGTADLAHYKALLLTTHPEYWSPTMVDRLEEYLAQGGALVYLGGNGLFERVEFDPNADRLIFLGGDPAALRARSYYRNLTPPRPERAVLGVAYRSDNYMTFAPFQVRAAEHRFFTGTGLRNGDLIGAQGRNGAASGWELDTSLPGNAADGVIVIAEGFDDRGSPPANLQLLARGTNPGYGADMTYYNTAGGGFVFAAGSICVGGSLVADAHLQTIVRNVLTECLAR